LLWKDARVIPILPFSTLSPNVPAYVLSVDVRAPEVVMKEALSTTTIPNVPFYSQFTDITSAKWKKVGCGIASLAMVIAYYKPDTVTVDTLLAQGIASGAYNTNAGWIHKGLISLSQRYGLGGSSYNLASSNTAVALETFRRSLAEGPVIASIHYKFDPKNPIPHLVVITAIDGEVVYYNDPASSKGQKQISTTQFLKAWKKKFIVLRPVDSKHQMT